MFPFQPIEQEDIFSNNLEPATQSAVFEPVIEPPVVRLSRKVAEASARAAATARASDATTLPIIQQDMIESAKRSYEIQQQLEATQAKIAETAPLPTRSGMNLADMLAAGIGGLFGGGQAINQGINLGYQNAALRDEDANNAAMRNYLQRQQLARMEYEGLQDQLGAESKTRDLLRQQLFRALETGDKNEFDLAMSELNNLANLQRDAIREDYASARQERDIAAAREKQERDIEAQRQTQAVNAFRALMAQTPPGQARQEVARRFIEGLGMEATPELVLALSAANYDDQLASENLEAKRLSNEARAIENRFLEEKLGLGLALDRAKLDEIKQKVQFAPLEFQESLRKAEAAREIARRGAEDREIKTRLDIWKASEEPRIQSAMGRLKANLERIKQLSQIEGEEREIARLEAENEKLIKQIDNSANKIAEAGYAPMNPFGGGGVSVDRAQNRLMLPRIVGEIGNLGKGTRPSQVAPKGKLPPGWKERKGI